MTQEQEQQLSQTMIAMMQSGGDAPKSTVEVPVYAWRLIRWEADVPLTEEQRQEALAIVPEAMALCGVSAACFAADGDVMTVLLALTRFPARAHRDPVLWLCAHALMEQASVALEQDGTMFIGEEFDLAATWAEHLKPMREISDWWMRVSPLDGAAAHRHRKELQTCIKRRQYAVLGGYVSRALREDQNLSVTCFAFVPLVIEAIWSQHAELSLRTLTEGLNLNEMTRRPRQALLAWLNALQPSLRACPQPGNAKPIEKVIDSIRADCSLPYSQANLSRSLGLTPAYFCRLFHEKRAALFDLPDPDADGEGADDALQQRTADAGRNQRGVRVSEQELFLSGIQEVHRDDTGGISGDGEGKVRWKLRTTSKTFPIPTNKYFPDG